MMKLGGKRRAFAPALLGALAFGAPTVALAQDSGEEIIVTGTRTAGIRAEDSPVPVVVLGAADLQRVGQPDLIAAIAQNVPSFQAQAFGGDTAAFTLSARLRGLSPNHTLVLVNGHRRHTTANLAVLGGAFQGGAAADLNFIPVASIGRIEVLQEGAAAQYGSDAIAGVVNIILKDDDSGGSFAATGGQYMDEGGETAAAGLNFGFAPVPDSFVNITLFTSFRDYSFRGGIDPRVVGAANLAIRPTVVNMPNYPYVNRILGDPRSRLSVITYNAGFDLGEVDLYSHGSYGHKRGQAFENYRTPERIPAIYPNGFNPQEESIEDDYSFTLGAAGTLASWGWDLATTWGEDQVQINTIKSGNVSLFNDTGFTPTNFLAGTFNASQWTTTLDFDRAFDVGMSGPLNVAFGFEYRRDTYAIGPGDAAARYKEGSQSFPGFALTDSGSHSRNSSAAYIDFAFEPFDGLYLDIAGRYEDYSDFGSTTIGKITGRYDFNDMFAVRGTVSTGFRAPTLAESYYSATNVSPTSAFVQLPPNSAAAALVGINGLDPEESTNYSLGFIAQPSDNFSITLDVYKIEIDSRIVGSGALYGIGGAVNSPAVVAAIAASGNVLDPTVTFQGISMFANGLDTETEGAELVINYASDFGSAGTVDWSLAANYVNTEVVSIAPSPAQLAPQSLYDAAAISYLENTAPDYRFVFGALWRLGPFSANLRQTLYGPSYDLESPDGGTYYRNEIDSTWTTDLELSYDITDNITAAIGANNLFNEYPPLKNATLLGIYAANNDNSAVTQYPTFSPFGYNGGFYYARVNVGF